MASIVDVTMLESYEERDVRPDEGRHPSCGDDAIELIGRQR